jgi:hypothetical protein
MRTRFLTNAEILLARTVFQTTLPYNQITISDAIGLGNRAFTVPMYNAGQAAAMAFGTLLLGPLATNFVLMRPSSYQINFGASGFANSMTSANLPTFIHELTHVWQSFNQIIPTSYIFNSLWHQTISGGSAYSYSPGQAWASYNVEQQASLVQDWFRSDGMSLSSPRFTYIRNNIRAGRP